MGNYVGGRGVVLDEFLSELNGEAMAMGG